MDRMIMIEFKEHKYMNYLLISETFEHLGIDHKTFIIDPVAAGEEDSFKEIATITYCADSHEHEAIRQELKELFKDSAIVRVMHCV